MSDDDTDPEGSKRQAARHARNAEAELEAAAEQNPERSDNPQQQHLEDMAEEAGKTADALDDQAGGES